MNEWLHNVTHPVAWLSLDEQDNDPARFLAYLIAALRWIDAGVGANTEALLQSPQPPPEPVLTSLINDLAAISSPFILALDDYHAVHTPAIHQQHAFLLEHQPPQMNQVIVTREDPPLPICRSISLTWWSTPSARWSRQRNADHMGCNLAVDMILL